MIQIVLNDQQVKLLRGANDTVQLVDKYGRVLGYVYDSFTSEEIAEARRRAASNGPWYTTAEVLEHLRSLESN